MRRKAPFISIVKDHFNPLTPRGVRQNGLTSWAWSTRFQSTHPSRGETRLFTAFTAFCKGFQSTHPSRGETLWWWRLGAGRIFQSTHPSRGETFTIEMKGALLFTFQSTHPSRGETFAGGIRGWPIRYFNPLTPRGVRLLPICRPPITKSDFNPLTPRGVRRCPHWLGTYTVGISIHSPLAG